ncbi:MAG: sugar ABC transporter ATP-binding protein [Firmicutes bacterium]|nr:sugar ABC transporter ATP-binding protein [Bacillota bacterium]
MELIAHNICKSFGPIKALDNVTIAFKAGEVKAVVGENGAGKSTLVKILAGLYRPDSGTVTLDGRSYNPASLNDAVKSGVAIVLQETTINPCLTIAENIFIDRLRDFVKPSGLIDWGKLKAEAQNVLDSLNAGIDVNSNIEGLDLGQWKIIELARAISHKPKVLFLDEVTAFLGAREVPALLGIVAELRKRGIAIGYISHHMGEVFKIADTITVMKDGKWVADRKVYEVTRQEIEAMMVGRDIGEEMYPKRDNEPSTDMVLSVDNLKVPGSVNGISFDLHRGEVLGIGGLKGSGGESILRAIYGDMPFGSGKMVLEGEPFCPRGPYDAVKHGIALVPGERTLEGLITILSVMFNMSLIAMPKRGLLLDRAAEARLAKAYVAELMIKTPDAMTACANLSGGNAQKVVLGKCLASRPRVLLLNNPTRGIDVGARYEIYHLINRLASQGLSIILLSEDLPELLSMSDRILIMRQGHINRSFGREDKPSEEEVISYML